MISESYYQYYHPLEGGPPNCFYLEFEEIQSRARILLAQRSEFHIRRITEVIEEMLRDDQVMIRPLEQLEKELQAANDETVPRYPRHESYVSNLANCRDLFELDKIKMVGELYWSEIFAVLALAIIASACEEQQHMEASPQCEAESADEYHRIGEYALEAMEAIVLAEGLSSLESETGINQVPQLVEKRLSDVARKAARAKQAPLNALKREFADFFGTGSHATKAEAARNFYAQLSDEKKRRLNERTYVRVLTESLKKE